ADFGLAAPISSPRMQHPACGTVHFAAPEVFQGFLTDRSDQYSLAVTYCLLRGGRVPFPNSPSSFRDTYVRPLPDLTMLQEIERPIIARGLATNPIDRWPTCGEMVEALAQLHPCSGPCLPPRPAPWRQAPRESVKRNSVSSPIDAIFGTSMKGF